MTVYEADLPGVGKKFEIELDGDTHLVIVIHNTGRRELYLRPSKGADSEKLFELSDQLARQVGTILEGAYFQPVEAGTIDTVIDEDSLIEWVTVDDDSPIAGQTLREARLRQETGVSVIAVQRDDDTFTNPDADMTILAGDVLVVLGSRESCKQLEGLVARDESTA